MRTAIALVLVSSVALSQDAPKLNPHNEGRSMILGIGETLPFGPSLCMESSEAQRREWNAQRAIGELDKLKESKGSPIVSVPVLVAIIAGSIAVGAAVGVGATLATRRP